MPMTPTQPTSFLQVADFLDPPEHRALLEHLSEALARLPAVPPRVAASPDAGCPSVDVGPLRATFDQRLRGMVGHLRRELGIDHFVCSGFDYRVTAYDGSSVTAGAGEGAAVDGTPRIGFVYTCSPPGSGVAGGALRLYDTVDFDGVATAAETFTEIEPLDNAIVFFPPDRHHEITRTRPGDGPATRYSVSGFIVGDRYRPTDPPGDVDVLRVLQQRYVPQLSVSGFEVRPTPAPVHTLLESLLALRAARCRMEETEPRDFPSGSPDLVDVMDLGADVLRALQPVHEEAAGVALVPSNVYGLRVYRPGNTLAMHVDLVATHVVSSVLQVAQDVDEPWPLVIEDGDRHHEVFLDAGQMVLYEGATNAHGRPSPLRGRSFVNLFAHYRPVDWPWTAESLVERARRDGVIDRFGRLTG
jgi:hypothetical protein